MKVMVGQKIRSARMLAGMSLRELSEKTGKVVSHTAIARYENEVMTPPGFVLEQLARALGVSREYFFERPEDKALEIGFRKMPGMSRAKSDLLRTRVDRKLIRRLEIERLLGIYPTISLLLNNLVIRSGDDAEEAAEMLRAGWDAGKGGIISVTELLEDHGVKIFAEDLPWAFDGLGGWASGALPLIVVNSKSDPEQLRIIILRELAHLLLKFDASLKEIEKEQLCTRFSNAFLVSRETFFREVGKKRHLISTPELIRMRETFGIPVKALMHRASLLGVINQEVYRTFKMRISINPSGNDLGWFCGRENFDRYKVMVFKAFTQELIPLDRAAARLDMLPLQFRMESRIF